MAKLTIEMPHVGESVTEAVIGKWLVSPGDSVRRYDPLVEVITDKVNMEVPSPRDGTITDLLVSEDDTVQMGAPIAQMEVEGAAPEPRSIVEPQEDTAASSGSSAQAAGRIGSMIIGANVGPTGGEFTDTSLQTERSPEPDETTSPSMPRRGGRRERDDRGARISPVVRRLAERHGLDVNAIKGTGAGGRVTRRDVETYLESRTSIQPDELIEPTAIRRIIAENMSRSFREIPHAWGTVEVDVTNLVRYREQNIERISTATGQRLTYLPIVLRQVAKALRDHRLLNSSWADGKVALKGEVNVGVAVAAEQGLIVPVLRNADRLTLEQTVSELARIVDSARAGKLRLEDVQGGTFTLNNTGALGSILGGAIINHPQAAIMTTEAIVKRPVVVETLDGAEAIAIRSMMNMCLSFDHRIIDGAEALAFMTDVKARLGSISQDDCS